MRVGVIDLGTNTFNILVVEVEDDKPVKWLLNTKAVVMLGKEGLNDGYISVQAFNRAFKTLGNFRLLLDKYQCDKEIAFGTSAIRSAKNAEEFIQKVTKNLNIFIEPISGEQEAEYIYCGVKNAVTFADENYLILDIGGGSNEFIIANNHKLLWKQSFPLGGARLLEKFKPHDPVLPIEIEQLINYLDQKLQPLKSAIQKYPVTKLVGSSGAFDSFAEILHYQKSNAVFPQERASSVIPIPDFDKLYKNLMLKSRKERLAVIGLEEFRVDTIVMAMVFTKFCIELAGIKEIIQSAYSLKEGVALQFREL